MAPYTRSLMTKLTMTHLEGVCEPQQQLLETGVGGSDWSAETAPTEARH